MVRTADSTYSVVSRSGGVYDKAPTEITEGVQPLGFTLCIAAEVLFVQGLQRRFAKLLAHALDGDGLLAP